MRDRDGRWTAEPNEPFNAGLGGISPETVRRVANPRNDGRALVLLWLAGASTVALGVLGESVILLAIGAVVLVLAVLWTVSRVR